MGNVSCKSMGGGPKNDPFPTAPKFTLKQSIVEQKVCEKDRPTECHIIDVCKEYKLNESTEEWEFIGNRELKFCHGALGVTPKEFADIRNFVLAVKLWIKRNIEAKNVTSENQDWTPLVTDSVSEDCPAPGSVRDLNGRCNDAQAPWDDSPGGYLTKP